MIFNSVDDAVVSRMIMSLNHTLYLSGAFEHFTNFGMVVDDVTLFDIGVEILMHEHKRFLDRIRLKRLLKQIQLPIRNSR